MLRLVKRGKVNDRFVSAGRSHRKLVKRLIRAEPKIDENAKRAVEDMVSRCEKFQKPLTLEQLRSMDMDTLIKTAYGG